ncbi:phospholipase/carboxylesterase [Ulvibacter sp. MAR_2010_11]|uniref:alpha/beta hydrolase n=1 Tax=Ulvibacter sp. MAR_2010_11 TaxID=1250229 RepID=UPI000C2B6CAA|nr:alpha/beta fold hydrolase [Ulvibacter sp. MAR_2010_11]PKA84051.1 phospholipase/carboxylesterase [Ulvibacter sp. MAR_2010_11]
MTKQTLLLEHNYKAPVTISEKAPAIIMLHGFGSDENDLFSFASEIPENYHIISLKAPIAMQPYGNAWYNIYFDDNDGKFSDDEQAIVSRDLISDCIDDIIEKYPVDKNNITLLGFSQGTILSFAVALSYPEKVKNVIGLSGYINEAILTKDFKNNDFSDLHVYTSHGSVDMVIPVTWARKTKPILDALGIDCTYSEFPVGHGVAPQNFFEFKNWLATVNSL